VRNAEKYPKPKPSTYTHDSRSVWHVNYRILTRPAAGRILRMRRRRYLQRAWYSPSATRASNIYKIISHIIIIIFYTRYVTCTNHHRHGIMLYLPVPEAPFRGYNYNYRQVPTYLSINVILLYAHLSRRAPSVHPSANCY